MSVRGIKQAKRRIAIRLMFILAGVFLAGFAVGAATCVAVAVSAGMLAL